MVSYCREDSSERLYKNYWFRYDRYMTRKGTQVFTKTSGGWVYWSVNSRFPFNDTGRNYWSFSTTGVYIHYPCFIIFHLSKRSHVVRGDNPTFRHRLSDIYPLCWETRKNENLFLTSYKVMGGGCTQFFESDGHYLQPRNHKESIIRGK